MRNEISARLTMERAMMAIAGVLLGAAFVLGVIWAMLGLVLR